VRRAARLLCLLGLGGFVSSGCDADPAVAPNLDLSRFQGRWYEIARVPRDHDAACYDTVADYQLVRPGKLQLTHRCHLGSASGPLSQFRAPATVEDPAVPAKLALQIGLYRGAYWVLEVGNDYEYALIGHPSLTMLWVLSREPTLDAATYQHLLDRAQGEGFATASLRRTPQSARND
jgi:apolipoprotein D and lipocalin family protein